jgi:predicted secreted protein
MKTIIAAAFLAVIGTPALAQPAPVQVDEGASGRMVRLQRGQELVVSVSQCVGCAYRWTVAPLPRTLTALPTTEVDTNDRSGPEPVVGGGKTVMYHFRAARAGSGALSLTYRPFRGRERGRTIRYNVVVR